MHIDFCSVSGSTLSAPEFLAKDDKRAAHHAPVLAGLDREFDFTAERASANSTTKRSRAARVDSLKRRARRTSIAGNTYKDPLLLAAEDAMHPSIRLIELTFNDHALPVVRLPTVRAAPEHIADALSAAYPQGITQPGRKEEFCPKPNRTLSSKESGFLGSMKDFWTRENLMILLPIILKTNGRVTLSVLDYLCVHFSEDFDVHYASPFSGSDDDFYIKEKYDNCIKSYKRKNFDVYARRKRILVEFALDDEPIVDAGITWAPECIRWDRKRLVGTRFVQGRRMCYLITSSGQLKHFFWSIPSGVVRYCIEHQDAIYNAKKNKDGTRNETRFVDIDDCGNKRRRSATSFCVRRRGVLIDCSDGISILYNGDEGASP